VQVLLRKPQPPQVPVSELFERSHHLHSPGKLHAPWHHQLQPTVQAKAAKAAQAKPAPIPPSRMSTSTHETPVSIEHWTMPKGSPPPLQLTPPPPTKQKGILTPTAQAAVKATPTTPQAVPQAKPQVQPLLKQVAKASFFSGKGMKVAATAIISKRATALVLLKIIFI